MRAEVLAWMQAQRMTEPGDTVVCAVSGGADSVSMLHVLLSLQDTLGIRIEAAHFNHHLRGAESDRDEAFVRQLCASLSVPLHTGGGDVQARGRRRRMNLWKRLRASSATRSLTHSPALSPRHTRRTTISRPCS